VVTSCARLLHEFDSSVQNHDPGSEHAGGVALKAGDVLFIPARTIHAAKNVGWGNGAELATYVVEKGKPLVVMVK
jgi:mannose-6-phosphate isomerase class I